MSETESRTVGSAQAVLSKVQTMTDGGFRLTLDLPETEIELVQNLLKIKSNPSKTPLFYVAFVEPEAEGEWTNG